MITRIVRFLTDSFRGIADYLHISITDRYKLRCVYCMSEHQTFLPKHDVLGIEEMDGICALMILTGIKKIRLIGREPAVCRGFLDLVRKLSPHRNTGSLSALIFLNNGTRLGEIADSFHGYGVGRVNVYLDKLDAEILGRVTRGGAQRGICQPRGREFVIDRRNPVPKIKRPRSLTGR
jgi:cyclic pyranopterin phosphate synthase